MGGWVGGAGWGAGCVLLARCFWEWKLRCLDQNFETNGGGAGGEGCGWFRFVDFLAGLDGLLISGWEVSRFPVILTFFTPGSKPAFPNLKRTETNLGHPQPQTRKPSK